MPDLAYEQVTTSAEVYAVIRAAHPDLVVFSSCSDPDGYRFGGGVHCRMDTEWGFEGAVYPLVGSSATWDRSEIHAERLREKRRYWLCVATREEE